MAFRRMVRCLGEPLAASDVAALERRLGVVLPEPYRRFLLEFNGGRPEPRFAPLHDNPADDRAILDLFFGVGTRDVVDLEWNRSTYEERMPANLLPIATDPGGNVFCLSVAGEDRGTVYFWAHHEEAPEGAPRPTRMSTSSRRASPSCSSGSMTSWRTIADSGRQLERRGGDTLRSRD